MELRVAICVADERDQRHLTTTLRLANQRSTGLRIQECALDSADVVILRRGEQVSLQLLRDSVATATRPAPTGKPVPVIYTMSETEKYPWVLRWPARTTDLLPLAETLYFHLQTTGLTRAPAAVSRQT